MNYDAGDFLRSFSMSAQSSAWVHIYTLTSNSCYSTPKPYKTVLK